MVSSPATLIFRGIAVNALEDGPRWNHAQNKTDKEFLFQCCKILDMRGEINCISKQPGCHLGLWAMVGLQKTS